MTDLVYASGIWQVQEGSIDEFGDRWKEFLGWTEGTLTGWSVEPPSRLRHQYGHQGAHDATYDYVLYVHCGVRWARLDGVWWKTDLFADSEGVDETANPPDGWGYLYDEGTMTILDERTADYVGGAEMTVRFQRTDFVDAPFGCR